jgi:hypothetical protein
VRYLRLLANAVLGGVLMASYVAVLILQLNPQVPTLSMTALAWLGAVLAFYVPYLGVVLFFLLLVAELLSARPFRPAWISVRLLAWIGAVAASAAAAITWANLRAFRNVLTRASAERLEESALVTSAAAVVLVGTAVWRYSVARRGSRTAAALLVLAMLLSVVVPLWLRGPGETAVPTPRRWTTPAPVLFAPRVRIIALDGASLGFIRQRVAAGQLPNFGRLLDRGAVVDLATVRPTDPEPAWAAAATGVAAPQNGVRSNSRYRVRAGDPHLVDVLPEYCVASALIYQGFVRAEPHTADSLAVRPLWDILQDYGLASGIVGWPLTYPARTDRGYLLTDRFDEATSSPLRLADADAADPTTAVDLARAVFDVWQAKAWHEILPAYAARSEERPHLERARWDHAYSEAAGELEQRFAPRLTAVRYEALDALGHSHLREALPERFGDARRTDPQRSILDRYYTFVDHEVGAAIRRLAPGDLLFVVSAYGMEPARLSRRLLARLLGVPGLSGTHDEAPDGFLLAYGSTVATGQFRRGAIADLTPTVLYYLGVPVGRDMDGFARTDLFVRSFALERPVKYIASHER